MLSGTLWHDGACWVLRAEGFELRAPTLRGLDEALRRELRLRGLLRPGGGVSFYMAYDNGTIPAWVRPYAQHYFDRVVKLKG
jgi:hypothetical protein